MALGITPLSWAQWLAKALDLPYTSYAFNGATTADVLREQLPRVRVDYDVATLYAGVNDVRDAGLRRRRLRARPRRRRGGTGGALRAPAHAHAARGPRPADVGAQAGRAPSAVVRRVAARHGAVVADLADFGGWTLVLPDVVHPTPLGQVEIADRAARALGVRDAAVGARRATAAATTRATPRRTPARSPATSRAGRASACSRRAERRRAQPAA